MPLTLGVLPSSLWSHAANPWGLAELTVESSHSPLGSYRAHSSCCSSIAHRYYDSEDLLAELASVTREDVQRQVPRLLERVHLECLVYGNYTAPEAADMCTRIEACISSAHGGGTLLPCEREHWRAYGLDCEDYE
jgi:secreted Zn-dependent insulinase-like peptidase